MLGRKPHAKTKERILELVKKHGHHWSLIAFLYSKEYRTPMTRKNARWHGIDAKRNKLSTNKPLTSGK